MRLFSFSTAPRGWKPGALARNTFFASGWQVVRLGLQVLYLIIAARMLGADGYGWFAGTLAMAAGFSPLVGLGFGLILVKQAARDPASFHIYWARNIAAVLLSAPVLVIVVLILASFVLPDPKRWHVISLMLFSELLFAPLIVVCANVYQAHEKLGSSTFVHVLLNLFRLIASIVLFFLYKEIDVELFGWGYFVATVVATLLALGLVIKKYGWPVWRLKGMMGEFKEGISFSASLVAGSIQAEFDKTLLLRISTAESAGIYSVASRVISASSIPLVSFMLAAVPRLFREGEKGLHAGSHLARKLLTPMVVYGGLSGCAIYAGAPLISSILGSEFSNSVDIIRLLAPMPLLSGLSVMLLSTLTCSGAQKERVMIEFIALGLSIALNLVLIPMMGAKGAAVAALCTQTALTGLLLIKML